MINKSCNWLPGPILRLRHLTLIFILAVDVGGYEWDMRFQTEVINGPIENNFVIYGGNQDASWSNAKVIAWQNTGTLIRQIENKKK